ncbi:MAG: hypothetical protein WC765_04160 [Phycisphaerae bacterium]|jgi:hypothetical protein
MRKILFAFVIVTLCLSGRLSAEELDIKGGFDASSAKGIPVGWVVSNRYFDKDGSVSVNDIPDTGKKSLQIISKTEAVHFYTIKIWPSTTGDKCIIKAMVKGSGQGSLSLYLYPDGIVMSKGFQATQEWTEYIAELTIPDRKVPVEGLRVVLVVSPGASIEFSDVTAEIVKNQ